MPEKTNRKLQEPHVKIWGKPFWKIQWAEIKNWFSQSISFKGPVLFLPVTLSSDFCKKVKYDINKDTKSLTELGKYLLSCFLWQYCQERYLEPNQTSMVELFWKNSKGILAVNCFWRKTHYKCYTVLLVKKKETNYISFHTFPYFYIILYDNYKLPSLCRH